MNKNALTEADICTKFVTPALVGSDGEKWDLMTQIREEFYFTKGRVILRGRSLRRGEARKADYLLYYMPNLPLAVLESLLAKYAETGIASVGSLDILKAAPLRTFCTPTETISLFGCKSEYLAAVRELENHLDPDAA